MARQTVSPVNFNVSYSNPGTFAVAPSTGIDSAGTGTGFATSWSGLQGVQYANNGYQWIWYYNGSTACNAYILIGEKTGSDVMPYTEDTVALTTSGYGWLGPYSPSKHNQPDTSQFSGAPGGVIGSSGQFLTCIDFSATTTLALRLYQMFPVS